LEQLKSLLSPFVRAPARTLNSDVEKEKEVIAGVGLGRPTARAFQRGTDDRKWRGGGNLNDRRQKFLHGEPSRGVSEPERERQSLDGTKTKKKGDDALMLQRKGVLAMDRGGA